MKNIQNKNAFTIMEIIIVVIIVGVISVFAVPQYAKSIQKIHERDAIMQLKSIHVANLMYKAQVGSYSIGTSIGISQINTNLKLNLIENDMTYAYTATLTDGVASAYEATAQWTSGGEGFTIQINQDTLSGSNPCCSAGNCPSLSNC